MTLTLTAGIGIFEGAIPVSGVFPGVGVPGAIGLAQIDSEQIRVRGNGTTQWLVDRAVNGTLANSHSNGATILPLYAVEATTPPQTSPVALLQSVAGTDVTVEAAFVEAGGHTYTATIAIPAGATVLDVIFRNTAVWTAATSASLTVGDTADTDGYIAATDVKTAPTADTNGAGSGISTRLSLGATVGPYAGGGGKFYAAADNLVGVIVSVGAGTAGRSRLLVEYALPTASVVVVS